MKGATAIINLKSLRHNLEKIQQYAPKSRLMAVVKANAYGHGLLTVAQALKNADYFSVARIEEALTLRSGGIIKPILLLEGFFSLEDLAVLQVNHIETVIHNFEQLVALEKVRLPEPVRVWMKIDTGMHRLGVRLEQADAFYQRLQNCPNVAKPIHIITHLSDVNPHHPVVTDQQIRSFDAFVQGKPGQKSIAASGAILLCPQSHRDVVRPGIALYGISPFEHFIGRDYGLLPVMTLQSPLIAVREHKAGETVGYAGEWISQTATFLGVLAIGYGDGYPQSAPTGTPVWINDRQVPIVGRVSMDMISVDLGRDSTDKVGDRAVLWGDQLSLEKVASYIGYTAYELVSKLTGRVAISYVN
ncbi:alanine racemase [Candidatus Williamhamiltonella defendens]|uniref:alanine racemase n=1 Tax=Candidatus Williamhamiltonella defendens TaxID=138072 RepID=UPI001582BC51|nr:alanine racemase [Candidatus Hamiltonella defensa]